MPLGHFKSFGNYPNQGSNLMNFNPMGHQMMGPNPMGPQSMGNGMGFPRMSLFKQVLGSPQLQNQVPQFMKGLKQGTPNFEQGANPHLFGGQGMGQSKGLSLFGNGAFQNPGMNFPGNMPQPPQPPLFPQPAQPPQPQQSLLDSHSSSPSSPTPSLFDVKPFSYVRDLLGRLGLGK